MVIYTIFVYHFVDSDLGFEISLKKRRWQKVRALKYSIEAPLHTCIGVAKKFQLEPVYFFIAFLVTKKKRTVSKKSIFFIPCLLNFSDLPSYGWDSRKKYTLRQLLICLEEGWCFGSCFTWKGANDVIGKSTRDLGVGGNYTN